MTMDRRMITKILSKTLMIIVLAYTYIPTVSAQEYSAPAVTVSKEKVRINGKICYSHIVLERQTLFSIAKAYGVTVADIEKFNPSLKNEGLKKNSILLIPSQEALQSDVKPSESKTAPAKEAVEKVAVENKDTKQTEAKVEVEKTEEKKAEERKAEKKENKKQKIHIRKWYEDLDVIAEKYGVTVEALMRANNLTGRKLNNRQKLIIPEPGEVFEPLTDMTEQSQKHDPHNDSAAVTDTTEAVSATETIKDTVFIPKDKVRMTVILPIKAAEENPSRNNIDFYSGVLLAVHDMAESGISTELNVYDSADQGHTVSNEDLTGSDAVIGPISSREIEKLFSEVPQVKSVISPLDPRAESLTWSHRNFIQIPTPHKAQYQDIVSWIKEDSRPEDKVLLISESGARQTDALIQMKEVTDSSGIDFQKFSYSILEGRDVIEPIMAMMTAEGTNRVLIASESEAFVNDVVRNLNILIHRKMNVILYAPSRIRTYDTIEVENLHNTNLHVSLAYYIDYTDQRVMNFLMKYRALYNTEPTQFSFQGYDTARYFIELCSKYGDGWMNRLSEDEKNMLQSTFRFIEVNDGSFVNNGVRRIVYEKDWNISKVR